ncbi:alpha/beta fold hydrolase [Thalassotalea maritima]|uniref:alpha/beta fold hydrolase n=1 Tax=Thalassotalea maritima TaxID=3242416 RepID=UPI003529A1FC
MQDLVIEKLSAHKSEPYPGVYVSGRGTPVVLLHSSLNSSRQWRVLEQALVTDYTVINIDLLGYGAAPMVDGQQAYDLSNETARILLALDSLIGEQPFHLVGHSFGGAVALKFAVEQSPRILSLSLYEPVAFHLLPINSLEYRQVSEFAANVARLEAEAATRLFTDVWNRPGFYDALPAKMRTQLAANIDKVKLDFNGLISESYTASDCQVIEAPILLMSGQQSPAMAQRIIDILRDNIGHAKWQRIDAGHMAPVTDASIVSELITCHVVGASSFC